MYTILRKLFGNYVPEEACFSLLDFIQYLTERRWNAKFWRKVERWRFPDIYKK